MITDTTQQITSVVIQDIMNEVETFYQVKDCDIELHTQYLTSISFEFTLGNFMTNEDYIVMIEESMSLLLEIHSSRIQVLVEQNSTLIYFTSEYFEDAEVMLHTMKSSIFEYEIISKLRSNGVLITKLVIYDPIQSEINIIVLTDEMPEEANVYMQATFMDAYEITIDTTFVSLSPTTFKPSRHPSSLIPTAVPSSQGKFIVILILCKNGLINNFTFCEVKNVK